MTQKKILLTSLSVSLLSGVGLLIMAYLNNEEISDVFSTADGRIIIASTLIGFFLVTYVVLSLLTSAKKGARMLFVVLLALGTASWFAYDSGVIYDVYDYITVEKNPYDGRYEPHNMTEKIEEIHKSRPYSLIIDGYTASLFGYDSNQPVRITSYNVCIDGDTLFLRNGSMTISEYCGMSSEGTLLELEFNSDTEGNLDCKNCNQAGFPNHWKKKD